MKKNKKEINELAKFIKQKFINAKFPFDKFDDEDIEIRNKIKKYPDQKYEKMVLFYLTNYSIAVNVFLYSDSIEFRLEKIDELISCDFSYDQSLESRINNFISIIQQSINLHDACYNFKSGLVNIKSKIETFTTSSK